ncbi:MAG: response regulator, partial [Anaerolineales bacterium]
MQDDGFLDGGKQIMRVLIAHGVPSARKQLKEAIEKLRDIKVRETATGAETLLQTLELKPDVVILAGEMPDQSSIRLTRLIKAKLPRTKVVVPFEGKVARDVALGAGVDGFFDGNQSLLETLQKMRASIGQSMPASRVETPQPIDWREHKLGIGIGAGIGVGLLVSLILIPAFTFPMVALAFGLLSFLYGLKYYLSVALILSATSGGPNGNGNGLNGIFN